MSDKPIEQPNDIIDRLIAEVRQLKVILASVETELRMSNSDFDLLTVTGAIKRLALDRAQALAQVSKLEKELNKLVMSKK